MGGPDAVPRPSVVASAAGAGSSASVMAVMTVRDLLIAEQAMPRAVTPWHSPCNPTLDSLFDDGSPDATSTGSRDLRGAMFVA